MEAYEYDRLKGCDKVCDKWHDKVWDERLLCCTHTLLCAYRKVMLPEHMVASDPKVPVKLRYSAFFKK